MSRRWSRSFGPYQQSPTPTQVQVDLLRVLVLVAFQSSSARRAKSGVRLNRAMNGAASRTVPAAWSLAEEVVWLSSLEFSSLHRDIRYKLSALSRVWKSKWLFGPPVTLLQCLEISRVGSTTRAGTVGNKALVPHMCGSCPSRGRLQLALALPHHSTTTSFFPAFVPTDNSGTIPTGGKDEFKTSG
jgi:hypothetical protein